MAGVGFSLVDLSNQDNLHGKSRAWFHGLIMSSGPWLVTVLAVGTLLFIAQISRINYFSVIEFRIMLTYNFALSAVVSAPFAMLANRALADLIFKRDVDVAGKLLVQNLIFCQVCVFPCAVILYVFALNLPFLAIINGIVNVQLLSVLWVLTSFLSAVQRYRIASLAFIIGMFVGVIGIVLFLPQLTAGLALLLFNLGVMLIVGIVMGVVLGDYHVSAARLIQLRPLAKTYVAFVLGGFFYNAGLWIDKALMWFASDSVMLQPSRLRYHPEYDTAIFLALFSIIPAIIFFVIHVETGFFKRFHNMMHVFLHKGSFNEVSLEQERVAKTMLRGLRNLFVLQGAVCALLILLAPYIFSLPGFDFYQINIYRVGVLACFFQVHVLVLSILLSYFDDRSGYLLTHAIFFFVTLVVTIITMIIGFPAYGYGMLAGSMAGFVFVALRLGGKMKTFIYYILFHRVV